MKRHYIHTKKRTPKSNSYLSICDAREHVSLSLIYFFFAFCILWRTIHVQKQMKLQLFVVRSLLKWTFYKWFGGRYLYMQQQHQQQLHIFIDKFFFFSHFFLLAFYSFVRKLKTSTSTSKNNESQKRLNG